VLYVANLPEAVYVPSASEKKTRKTPQGSSTWPRTGFVQLRRSAGDSDDDEANEAGTW
jgi:phage-related protein